MIRLEEDDRSIDVLELLGYADGMSMLSSKLKATMAFRTKLFNMGKLSTRFEKWAFNAIHKNKPKRLKFCLTKLKVVPSATRHVATLQYLIRPLKINFMFYLGGRAKKQHKWVQKTQNLSIKY